jgi:peptidoglycan/LPS O-acetylase OafA/YrhL
MYKNEYRPDIDGLRALAIIAVLIYHAFPSALQGGFVGVDIFFVISGFLITNIIIGSIKEGSFTYANFYRRRVMRLFPSLLIVLMTTLIMGWLFLFPNEFEQLGKHMFSGLLYYSNLQLYSEAGYFDEVSNFKPLLHLWSLGIEEQFYILWPILLVLFNLSGKRYLLGIFFFIILSFFSCVVFLDNGSKDAAFYLPFNRFWELAIGGLLVFLIRWRGLESKFIASILSIVGLILISYAGYSFESDNFPGAHALFPVLGAALLILGYASQSNKIILGNRIFVYIGLISYPLYLWHWPLISFAHILELTGFYFMMFVLIMSVILAVITREIFEVRLKELWTVKILLALAGILLFFSSLIILERITSRNNIAGVILAEESRTDWEYGLGMEKIMTPNGLNTYVIKGGEFNTLFWGDSHIQQYSPRIVQTIKADPQGYSTATFITQGGCPPILNVYDAKHPKCNANFKNSVFDYANSDAVDRVVISFLSGYLINQGVTSRKGYYYQGELEKSYMNQTGIPFAYNSIKDMFEIMISNGKQVYLIIDPPFGKEFDPKYFYSGGRINGFESRLSSTVAYRKEQSDVRDQLIDIAIRTGVKIIDPIDKLCEYGQCMVVSDGGNPLYKDGDHLRASYVKENLSILDELVVPK